MALWGSPSVPLGGPFSSLRGKYGRRRVVGIWALFAAQIVRPLGSRSTVARAYRPLKIQTRLQKVKIGVNQFWRRHYPHPRACELSHRSNIDWDVTNLKCDLPTQGPITVPHVNPSAPQHRSGSSGHATSRSPQAWGLVSNGSIHNSIGQFQQLSSHRRRERTPPELSVRWPCVTVLTMDEGNCCSSVLGALSRSVQPTSLRNGVKVPGSESHPAGSRAWFGRGHARH